MIKLSEKLIPYRSLIQNFTSLFILQIANYLFPLIVLPYIVRILGPAKYGLINFAAAFIAYFNLISDYGFNLSGIKDISLLRNDREELSKCFSTILLIKLILAAILFVIFILIIFLIPFFKQYWELYLLSYGMVIGLVLFPGWFYQGIEEMKYITLIQVTVRCIMTLLIFLMIKRGNDYLLLVSLYSVSQLLIGLSGLAIANIKFGIKFILPNVEEIKDRFKSGWNIFQSMVAINIYTTSNVFILGLFASETVIGYFAAADKIRIAFHGVQSVIAQTVFPYVNSLVKESHSKFILFIRKLFRIQTVIGITFSSLLFIFSNQLVELVLGDKFAVSGELLRIISILPLVISLSNIFGIQIMVSLGYEKAFNIIISSVALFHVFLLLILVPRYLAVGTSTSMVTTEICVAILTYIFVKRKKILFVKKLNMTF